MNRTALTILLLATLAACASKPPVPAAPPAPPVASRPLLPPATLGQERQANQVVRASIGARALTFNCVVTVKGGVMTVVGLNATGLRLFTVRYDGSNVQAEKSPGVPASLEPEHLLADLQLVFWPLAALQTRLQPEGWQLSEPAPGTRRLRHGDQLVAEVHYGAEDPWAGRSLLVNLRFGYSLQIDSQAP
jgi:hypothetical protein